MSSKKSLVNKVNCYSLARMWNFDWLIAMPLKQLFCPTDQKSPVDSSVLFRNLKTFSMRLLLTDQWDFNS